MDSSPSSPKDSQKPSSEHVSGFDIFYQLTYMSAIATSGLTRSQIFARAAALPCPVARYFEDVQTLATSLHYDYPTACRTVGQRLKLAEVKSFFLRFADALASGEPLGTFLSREARAQSETYSNEYERDLETLKKWTDAYSSITISGALIVIINLVSTMIYSVGTTMMAVLISVAVLMGILGAWVLGRSAPQETMVLSPPAGSPGQLLARKLLPIVPLAVIAGTVIAYLGVDLGWSLLVCAVIVAPVGIISLRSDKELGNKELEIGPFLRSLGGMAASTGTTTTEALGRIDLDSFPFLALNVSALTMRLRARLKPGLCWKRFGDETGSKLISQAIGIFYHAVALGGDPEEASSLTSMFTTQTALLRSKRQVVSATFSWLVLVMHGALTALMLIVLRVTLEFRNLVQSAIDPDMSAQAISAISTPLLSMGDTQLKMLSQLTIGMVLLLCLTNAFAIINTEGGFKLKIFYHLALLMFVSALGFFFGPPLVKAFM